VGGVRDEVGGTGKAFDYVFVRDETVAHAVVSLFFAHLIELKMLNCSKYRDLCLALVVCCPIHGPRPRPPLPYIVTLRAV